MNHEPLPHFVHKICGMFDLATIRGHNLLLNDEHFGNLNISSESGCVLICVLQCALDRICVENGKEADNNALEYISLQLVLK